MTIENLFIEIKQFLHKFYKERLLKDSNVFYDFKICDQWYSLVFIIFEDRHSQYKRINENELFSVLKNFIHSVLLSETQSEEIDDIIYLIHDMLPVRIVIKMWKKSDPVQYDTETEARYESLIREGWKNRLYNMIKRSYDRGLTLSEITSRTRWINDPNIRRELLKNLCNQHIVEEYQIKAQSRKGTIVYRVKK